MSAQPKPGEFWRVVLEGTVLPRKSREGEFWLAARRGTTYAEQAISGPLVVSVERLPDPEPEWQVGDVVRDAGGDVWAAERWTVIDEKGGTAGSRIIWQRVGGNAPAHQPQRPLTRLVPEA